MFITDSLVSQLCPMVRKCLGKEENYDLRMDTVMVRFNRWAWSLMGVVFYYS